MSLGLAYWIIMLVWIVFSGVQAYGSNAWPQFPFVLLLLLIILGFAVFGAAIKG